MTMNELVAKNRSYRRFHQEESVGRETLTQLVGLAGHLRGGCCYACVVLTDVPSSNRVAPCLAKPALMHPAHCITSSPGG